MLRKIAIRALDRVANRIGCAVLDIAEWYVIWGKAQEINEKADKVAAYAEELIQENQNLRTAYDALLEEMEELRNG